MATDWFSWTFPMPLDELPERFPAFVHSDIPDAMSDRFGPDSMTVSPGDWLHGAIVVMRDLLGGEAAEPLLVDPHSIATPDADRGWTEGFLINAIHPGQFAGLIAMIEAWLGAAATNPAPIASALHEDDFWLVKEFEYAQAYSPGDPYEAEGDRSYLLFWFLRMLLAKLHAAHETGEAIVHVRYLYFAPREVS